ncbi:zinc finger BED domain-containing protein 4-like [Centruroides sculpturatus]|uniref:zinc finger BED domain-containing protein 4-like n=1 Tax=Centruroides sculpturatus TaxID=218467 RepID=UPI000C6E4EF8|nr:zinc finger BED domain-containing protein 4-like [Centruroides sculpturatus]
MNKRSKISSVWSHFTILNNELKLAECDICAKKLSYHSTITNLKKHLSRKHPAINLEALHKNEDGVVVSTSTSSNNHVETSRLHEFNKFSNRRKQRFSSSLIPQRNFIDKKLLNLFIIDLQPFSIVEGRGFAQFIKALDPNYELPKKKVITQTIIPTLYKQCLHKVTEKLSMAKAVCLTFDSWTSENNEPYLSLTAHYITDEFQFQSMLLGCILQDGSYLAEEIRSIVEKFNLSDKILIVVSEDVANLRTVAQQLNWEWFCCYAHTLNSILQNSLQHIGPLLKKIRQIVGYVKRNIITISHSSTCQQETSAGEKLIHDDVGRWNSTYYMVERFVELREIVATLFNEHVPLLTEEEWGICKQVLKILKPFEEVTVQLCREQYVMASQIIIFTNGLISVCTELMEQNFDRTVKNVLNSLLHDLSTRFSSLENNKNIALCSFLDPRFKLLAFSDRSATDEVKKTVVELVAGETNKGKTDLILEEEEPENGDNEFSVWKNFDMLSSKVKSTGK